MKLELEQVFDKYPNPFYIVRPIVVDGKAEDFEYVYVNNAFSNFLGIPAENLVGHTYLECFKIKGERAWLEFFTNAAYGKEHVFVNATSGIISKKMYSEGFFVDPDMCGCIIHDYCDLSDSWNNEREELVRMAHCDFLTGFFNRFYLDEWTMDLSHRRRIGINYLDINHLKEINDEYGHVAGDKLILRVCDMMRKNYKRSLIFRVGGDEFVIITPNLSRDEFLTMSREGEQAFAASGLAAVGYEYYENVVDFQACIEHCDYLMYINKTNLR
jgi:diguanylate cyclase (GGDEF)-like protein